MTFDDLFCLYEAQSVGLADKHWLCGKGEGLAGNGVYVTDPNWILFVICKTF